jgi:excinuclease ABC subunit A
MIIMSERSSFAHASAPDRLCSRSCSGSFAPRFVNACRSQERVLVANFKGPWQAVSLTVHRLSEIDTPAFREFLKQAVASFQQNLIKVQTRPEDVMPWKLNGQRWHLSDKGFPPGKQIAWDRALLSRVLELVKEVEPGLEVVWTTRDAILLKVPGINHSWARWKTKESLGLDCRLLGKKGQFNLSQIEQFGIAANIDGSRAELDMIQLVFQNGEHLHAAKLKELLAEHLRGFREVLGKSRP